MIKFKGKKILVLGLSTSGEQVIRLLNHHRIHVHMSDQSITEKDLMLDQELTTYIDYQCLEEQIAEFDILIKSPGIPDHHAFIQKAKKNKVLVISEIEVAYQFMPKGKKIIGVTGTNGKTTTTTLITKIINEAGYNACSCGNIGYSLSEAVLVDLYDVFVCECSSFQLNNIVDFKPDIAVILNISPNHLDYHETFEAYLQAKLNLIRLMGENDTLVYNEDDPVLRERLIAYDIKKVSFSLKRLKQDSYADQKEIFLKQEAVLTLDRIQLLGKENHMNIMAAILACEALNIKHEAMVEAVYNFKPLKYRIEYLNTYEGVRFYNDSKSTNVQASICAVNAVDSPIILIVGGKLKEDHYADLFQHEKIKMILTFGENRFVLKKVADEQQKVCFVCDNLLEVIRLLKKIMTKGDTVLFSPAAQSFDLYDNYVERGEDFNTLFSTVIQFK
jgi:UDP-N-acetylmuramoylalanine--D-glutamate ligase